MLSRFYLKKRIILGQPVNLNGNSNNLRLSAGYRVISDPYYSEKKIENDLYCVKKTFESIFQLLEK